MAAMQEIGSPCALVAPGPEHDEPKLQRRERKSLISLGDEASLSWYFGQGLSIYDRSTFGAIINKLIMDAFGSGPCDKCEGSGILETGGFAVSDQCRSCRGEGKIGQPPKWCPTCQGYGKVEPFEYVVAHGGWCFTCRGTGSTPLDRKAQHRTRCTRCTGRRSPDCRSCAWCLGTGHEPMSARPQNRTSEGCGIQPDDSALTRFAITSRRVATVHAQSPALAQVLGVYYGDIGQRWASTDQGRIFSLFHLTGPGKKLARWGEKAGKGADLGLSVQERIGTQAALDKEQPKRERTVLLEGAGKAAKDLYGRAAQAWNQQADGKVDGKVMLRLADRLTEVGHGGLGEQIRTHARELV